MAMYKLKSGRDRLCEWLSDDSSHIINQCGDILSLNEFLEIQNQTCAPKKMQMLLKIIMQKGEETCQSFVDILRKNRAHYHQLQEFFNPNVHGAPTMAADSSSVVTARTIADIKGKSLNSTIVVSGPGSSRPGNVAGQVAQANYTAIDNSVVCADNILNACFDGDINLSVTVNTSQVHSGRVNESLPSSQEPAVKMIREHKDKLIACLMADRTFILNCVHARDIITDIDYQNLKDISQSEKTVTSLLDLVMFKGQQSCACLLEVLRESEVLKTYPQLRDILKQTL